VAFDVFAVMGNAINQAPDAGVVEQNHFSPRRERIGDRRIPVVGRPREMLKA
jgi:hypothetical protein